LSAPSKSMETVRYVPTEVISIAANAWRITDPRLTALPPELLSLIRPLSSQRSREIHTRFPVFENYPRPFDPRRYHAARVTSLPEENPSLAWAVILGPEEYAVFVEPGPVPPGSAAGDPAFGGVLLRCRPAAAELLPPAASPGERRISGIRMGRAPWRRDAGRVVNSTRPRTIAAHRPRKVSAAASASFRLAAAAGATSWLAIWTTCRPLTAA
jgi:hypothetical protein